LLNRNEGKGLRVMTEDEMVKKLPPISDQLRAAIDRETQEAYSRGATAVWQSLGVGPDLPNEAVAEGDLYVVRPKAKPVESEEHDFMPGGHGP